MIFRQERITQNIKKPKLANLRRPKPRKKIKNRAEIFKKISKINFNFNSKIKKKRKKITKKDIHDSQRLAFFLNTSTSKVKNPNNRHP